MCRRSTYAKRSQLKAWQQSVAQRGMQQTHKVGGQLTQPDYEQLHPVRRARNKSMCDALGVFRNIISCGAATDYSRALWGHGRVHNGIGVVAKQAATELTGASLDYVLLRCDNVEAASQAIVRASDMQTGGKRVHVKMYMQRARIYNGWKSPL